MEGGSALEQPRVPLLAGARGGGDVGDDCSSDKPRSRSEDSRSSSGELECRICGDTKATAGNPFISPCDCSGSISSVHVECLEKWILSRPGNRSADGENMECEICHGQYRIKLEHRLKLTLDTICSLSTLSHVAESLFLCLSIASMLVIIVDVEGVVVSNSTGMVCIASTIIVFLLLTCRRLYLRWFRMTSVPRISPLDSV